MLDVHTVGQLAQAAAACTQSVHYRPGVELPDTLDVIAADAPARALVIARHKRPGTLRTRRQQGRDEIIIPLADIHLDRIDILLDAWMISDRIILPTTPAAVLAAAWARAALHEQSPALRHTSREQATAGALALLELRDDPVLHPAAGLLLREGQPPGRALALARAIHAP